jgi:hypothetical protein
MLHITRSQKGILRAGNVKPQRQIGPHPCSPDSFELCQGDIYRRQRQYIHTAQPQPEHLKATSGIMSSASLIATKCCLCAFPNNCIL